MFNISFFLVFCGFFMLSAQATTLSCSHASMCSLAQEILQTKQDIKYDILIKEDVDPHHFSPSQKQLKQLISAPKLILAPFELQPWAESIITKRSDNSTIWPQSKKLPIKGSAEALAHFWLHPKLICLYKLNLATLMSQKWNLTIKELNCQKEEGLQKKFDALKSKLSEYKVLLTHDALSPLLSSLTPSLLSLRTSHHGSSLTTKEMKKFYDFLKNKDESKIVWIIESQIELPSRIQNRMDQKDLKIKISTNFSETQNIYHILNSLLKELESLP